MLESGQTVVVGVWPHEELEKRGRLLAALELVIPVRFVPGSTGGSGCEAAVVFASERRAEAGSAVPTGVPTLVLLESASSTSTKPADVLLADDELVARCLRDRRIEDENAAGLEPLSVQDGDVVLAATSSGPLWSLRLRNEGELFTAACAPPELDAGVPLRGLLRTGRFLGLLPLVAFLRRVSARVEWARPPLRATFVIDDPNLHWPTYGYLRYHDLAGWARRDGYHVTMAMVPLDAWFVHPRAAAIFRSHDDVLSLAIHGNDHVKRELAAPKTRAEGRPLVDAALRRMERFERRSRLRVGRVMVPPHGVCSGPMLAALADGGLDAACYEAGVFQSFDPRLGGWTPATLGEGGMPVMLRRVTTQPTDDFVFDAYLGQPLVVYGHHEDFSRGSSAFAEAAASINGLGDVRWGSLSELAETNFTSRADDGSLRIHPYSRRVRVEVPEGVSALVVEQPPGWAGVSSDALTFESVGATTTRARAAFGAAFGVAPGSEVVIRVTRAGAVAGDTAGRAAPWQPWPLGRRLLSEGRDRLTPLIQSHQ